MKQGEGIFFKKVAVAAGAAKAEAEILCGVGVDERLDAQAGVEAGQKRAVFTQCETVGKLGEADENQGQQEFCVPFVIEQDVQVVEGVLR